MNQKMTTTTEHTPAELNEWAAEVSGVRHLEGGTPQDVLVSFWAQNHLRYCISAALDFDDPATTTARSVRKVIDATTDWLANKHGQPEWAINTDLIEAQAANDFSFRFLFCQHEVERAIAYKLAEERNTRPVPPRTKEEAIAREEAGVDVFLADETEWQIKKVGASSDDKGVTEVRWEFEGFDSKKITFWVE